MVSKYYFFLFLVDILNLYDILCSNNQCCPHYNMMDVDTVKTTTALPLKKKENPMYDKYMGFFI